VCVCVSIDYFVHSKVLVSNDVFIPKIKKSQIKVTSLRNLLYRTFVSKQECQIKCDERKLELELE